MIDLERLQELADIMLMRAQTLRIQQSQLLAESDWEKERYKPIADNAWHELNKAHRVLTEYIAAISSS